MLKWNFWEENLDVILDFKPYNTNMENRIFRYKEKLYFLKSDYIFYKDIFGFIGIYNKEYSDIFGVSYSQKVITHN